jgi:hypothetical protein
MSSPYEAPSLAESTYTKHAPLKDIPIIGRPATVPTEVTVHSEGIFHGLPTYDESTHGQVAIVAGANGISGGHMLRVMAKHPKIWKRVHSISRRPAMESLPSHFTSHSIDLYNATPESVAEQLKKEGITHVCVPIFFFFVELFILTQTEKVTTLFSMHSCL